MLLQIWKLKFGTYRDLKIKLPHSQKHIKNLIYLAMQGITENSAQFFDFNACVKLIENCTDQTEK